MNMPIIKAGNFQASPIKPDKSIIERVAFYEPGAARKYIKDVDEEFGDNLPAIFKNEVFRVMSQKDQALKFALS